MLTCLYRYSTGNEVVKVDDVIKTLTCLYSKRRSSISIALSTVRGQVSDLMISTVRRVRAAIEVENRRRKSTSLPLQVQYRYRRG